MRTGYRIEHHVVINDADDSKTHRWTVYNPYGDPVCDELTRQQARERIAYLVNAHANVDAETAVTRRTDR